MERDDRDNSPEDVVAEDGLVEAVQAPVPALLRQPGLAAGQLEHQAAVLRRGEGHLVQTCNRCLTMLTTTGSFPRIQRM